MRTPLRISGLLLLLVAWPAAAAAAGALPIVGERIQLSGPIAFDSNSARLTPAARRLLDSVAATLETELDISRLEIGVHTDSRGSSAYNKKKSQERADAIRRYLIEKGIPAGRLQAVGFGEERPIDSNRTAAGRARNRRVELVVKARCPAGQIWADEGCRPR